LCLAEKQQFFSGGSIKQILEMFSKPLRSAPCFLIAINPQKYAYHFRLQIIIVISAKNNR